MLYKISHHGWPVRSWVVDLPPPVVSVCVALKHLSLVSSPIISGPKHRHSQFIITTTDP